MQRPRTRQPLRFGRLLPCLFACILAPSGCGPAQPGATQPSYEANVPQNPAKGAPAPADPGPDDPAPAASGPGNEDPATDGALGIERTSDTSFVVQRAFVDALLSNQAELMRGARFAPTAPGVDPSGVVVSEIVAGSALDQLGIRDRDVLVSMNGGMLATPDGALEAYAASRDADRIELVVQREGRLVTYRYSIE